MLLMVIVRKKLSKLRQELLPYSEIEVYQFGELLVIERDHPDRLDGYTLVTRPAFAYPNGAYDDEDLPYIPFDEAYEVTACMAARMRIRSQFKPDEKLITGLTAELDQGMIELYELNEGYLNLHFFPPGSLIVIKRQPTTGCINAMSMLKAMLADQSKVDAVLSTVSLEGFNLLLYRSQPEEADWDPPSGVYVMPGVGSLCYAGLQGFLSVLDEIREGNLMDHPLCHNLRAGDWAMDYTVDRLKK